MSAIFDRKLYQFLEELSQNNNRGWFNDNKDRYINDVRDRLSQFIVEMSPKLAKISRHIVADPRPMGGSMFRIYRDTRFSKDKTPYKTHAAVHFRHVVEKDVHGPGLYFHIGPQGNSVGGGIWHPPTPIVRNIRLYIDGHQQKWRSITQAPTFTGLFGEVQGDRLKRVPREFDADHPLGDTLRLKDFYAMKSIARKDVTATGLVEEVTAVYAAISPLMSFLSKAVGLGW